MMFLNKQGHMCISYECNIKKKGIEGLLCFLVDRFAQIKSPSWGAVVFKFMKI